MDITEMTNGELFGVLLCREEPQYGYTLNDYVREWNRRYDNGMKYEVDVPPLND
jgi:hypothetical protein